MTFTDKPIMREDKKIMKQIEFEGDWLQWFYDLSVQEKDFVMTQAIAFMTHEQMKLIRVRKIKADKF